MKKTILNIIIALGLVFLFLLFQKINHDSKASKWPSVEGVVVNSTVVKKFKNIKLRYWPFIQYSYIVENEKYEKIYYEPMSSGYLKKEHALKITNRFPEGATVTVHYNPDNPDDNILANLQ
jgi:hypothetical protein